MADPARLICAAAQVLEQGQGVRFTVPRPGGEIAAFLIRYQGKVYAYRNRCAHMEVELDWMPGEFFDESGVYLICATHGAAYGPASGACRGGPCRGRGLEAIPVEERDGQIFCLI
jgi:nitrite reductase/ring-hydroxylating ferredoxin subunit